jgi:hypothetical protein
MDIYTEWHNEYRLFAGHNCDIYDLKLKLYISKNDWENNKRMMSDFPEEYSLGCDEVDNETVCCEFMMHPKNSKLGIAFNYPADANWTFDTEWSDCVDNMES